ncbi:MAG: hypothetical protein RL600_410 [Actinomycetota bacterium]|jgi:hypothetical protein
MAGLIDFVKVNTDGLESSPQAEALAGLRANEARYFKNKYDADFVTKPAAKAAKLIKYVSKVLLERDIVISSEPLEASELIVDGIRWTHIFYRSGLAVNVLYTIEPGGKRAVGFKLRDGMPVPKELVDKFKFATMKSKLAGNIRGTFFVIKGEY